MLPVEGYGYWEVYLLYTSYVGILTFGYNDGIYLKYGERNYDQLPVSLLRSATRLFAVLMFAITLTFSLLVLLSSAEYDLKFALFFACSNIFVLAVSCFFVFICQITNQFKYYSLFSTIDKIAVLITIFLLFIINQENYEFVIIADFIAKIGVLVLMVSKMPELVFGPQESLKESWKFMLSNMSVGIKLMIANLMSMLLIGAGKFIVQFLGDISTFAVFSFGISITGLVLTAITAISLVLYPAIKRMSESRYGELFRKLNSFTRIISISSLLVYYPVCILVEKFYPNYLGVLSYLSFLFLTVFYQCKITLVNNTFYKVLRLEKQLLIANLSCVALFCVIALISFSLTKAIDSIAISIFVAMCFRSYSSEHYLSRVLNLSTDQNDLVELSAIIAFILTVKLLSIYVSFAIMAVIVIMWLYVDRKSLQYILSSVKNK